MFNGVLRWLGLVPVTTERDAELAVLRHFERGQAPHSFSLDYQEVMVRDVRLDVRSTGRFQADAIGQE